MTINVLFFGGAQASQSDVDSWKTSALKQRSDLWVKAYAWPPGANPYNPTAGSDWNHTAKQIADIVHSFKDETYLVGHSSGCAFTNRVSDYLSPGSVHLICLDGFAPSHGWENQDKTQVWSAKLDDNLSLNYNALKNEPKFKVYMPRNDCRAVWPLHFSLVNTMSNDSRVKSILHGYDDCAANLCWLKS